MAPQCIDYWLYLDRAARTVRISVEGWDWGEQTLDVTGDADVDGARIAALFARILRLET